jgi:hypothetical protein
MRYEQWVLEAGGRIKGNSDESSSVKSDGPEVISLYLLKQSNEEQMFAIYSLLKFEPLVTQFYLENFIFPAYMENKVQKLSASGIELGGEMLFKRRVGFSGTPSDLLPIELGKCGYEKGSDGQMINVLTNEKVCSFEVCRENWSPTNLLDSIANCPQRYHALIDTGALITGLSNLEVAAYLLDHGLPWCEGVVFLDDNDAKVVLIRSTRRVLKMAQCGIQPDRRFAFYDQIHVNYTHPYPHLAHDTHLNTDNY